MIYQAKQISATFLAERKGQARGEVQGRALKPMGLKDMLNMRIMITIVLGTGTVGKGLKGKK